MPTDKLQIFENSEFGKIRTLTQEDGEPRFCVADVCKALQYKNSRDAIRKHVDAEDVAKCYTLTKGGSQHLLYVNEAGLYSLIFGSTLPMAKAFKRWVTSEVLPAIRKTGGYGLPEDNRTLVKRYNTDCAIMAAKFGLCESSADAIMAFGTYSAGLGPDHDISMSELAKVYGMTHAEFCDLLERNKIIERNGRQWSCWLDDRDKLLRLTRDYTVAVDGEIVTSHIKWTNYGRMFIFYVLARDCDILPTDMMTPPTTQQLTDNSNETDNTHRYHLPS